MKRSKKMHARTCKTPGPGSAPGVMGTPSSGHFEQLGTRLKPQHPAPGPASARTRPPPPPPARPRPKPGPRGGAPSRLPVAPSSGQDGGSGSESRSFPSRPRATGVLRPASPTGVPLAIHLPASTSQPAAPRFEAGLGAWLEAWLRLDTHRGPAHRERRACAARVFRPGVWQWAVWRAIPRPRPSPGVLRTRGPVLLWLFGCGPGAGPVTTNKRFFLGMFLWGTAARL